MNNWMIKEQFAFTMKEVFYDIITGEEEEGIFYFDEDGLPDEIDRIHYKTSYPFEPSFIINQGTEEETYDPLVETLLQKMLQRFGNHYFLIKENDAPISLKERSEQLSKIMRLVDYTYPKYSTILKLYEDNKSKLMDKLASIDSETHSTSQSENHASIDNDESKLLINDTPQSQYDPAYEDDPYVSEFHKEKNKYTKNGNSSITGSGSVSRTHSSDPTTIMARINEIEKQYSQVMKRWLDEFSGLFIEEGNV